MSTNFTRAFRQLRKDGYIALQNHLCCSTCACYDISERLASKGVDPDKGLYAYYHVQDADSFRKTGGCYIGWQGDAKHIISVLENNQLRCEWDGSPDSRIFVMTHCHERYWDRDKVDTRSDG